MAGSPDHSREQLRKMLEASKMLEQASQGQLNGLTDHVYQTEGKLTPEAEMRLREMVGKTRQEVDQLIQFVLQASQNLSNLSSSGQDSQAASRVQKKYETGRFERVLPLPGQTPRQPEPSRHSPTPSSGEAVPLAVLPGTIQQKLQDMIQADPQNFVQTYLAPAFAPKFDQLKFIAKGGMGIIVKARQVSLHRDVAIKLNTQMTDAAMVQSFMNEGKNAAQAESANVVEVYDSDFVKILLGKIQVLVPYHLLKFVEGAKDGTFLLKAMEKAEKPFPEEAALLLGKQFATGLAAAHKKGIIHRDVKPDNVLIPPDEQRLISEWVNDGDAKNLIKGLHGVTGLKVADFGLAGVRSQTIKQEMQTSAEAQQVVSDQHTLTGDNSIIGTLYYIPPEGYADAQSAGKPWDVYSLGLVVYSLLTGNNDPLKFSKGIKRGTDTPMGYAIKIGGDQNKTPAISEEDPFIKKFIEQDPRNKRIVKMLQKMTAFDPAERPTLEEFLQWIEEELDKRSEKTLRAKKAEKKAEVASKGKRKVTWVAGGIGVALLSLLASYPFINKSNLREGFLKTQAQGMKDTEDLLNSKDWSAAITLLNNQIKLVVDSEFLNEQERQDQLTSLRGKLQHATTQLEKQSRAEGLIAEGDRFFQADGATFAEIKRTLSRETGQENPAPETVRDRLLQEAKRFYSEALQAGEGTQAAEAAQRKLDQWNYQTGIRAYNRGNSFLAEESFEQISELSDEVRVGAQRRLSSLRSWQDMEPDIRTRAEEIFSSGNRASFSSAVSSLGPIKKADDTYEAYSAENFAILMKVQHHFDDWIATLTGEESNLDASQRIARDQLIQERLARMEILRTTIMEALPLVPHFLPESVQYLQTFFYGNLLIKESQIDVALNNRNYDQAIQNYLKLLVYVEKLTALNQQEGVAFDPPEGMEEFLSELLKNAMMKARDRLPPNKKAQLNGLLRELFQDDASFIRTRTAGYLD